MAIAVGSAPATASSARDRLGKEMAASTALPPPAPALSASRTMIELGEDPGLTAPFTEYSGWSPVLQVAYAPSSEFQTVMANVVWTSSDEVHFEYDGARFPGLFQNASLRVGIEPTTGPPVQTVGQPLAVQVIPQAGVTVVPEERLPDGRITPNGGVGARLAPGYFMVDAEANVKRTVGPGFNGPLAYVYLRERHGVFHRIARMRWRFGHSPVDADSPAVIRGHESIHNRALGSVLKSGDRHFLNAVYLVCSPSQIVPEMGQPFSYPACGKATIHPGGPYGATFVTKNLPGFD